MKTIITFKKNVVQERKHTWLMSKQYLLAVIVKTMNVNETEKM